MSLRIETAATRWVPGAVLIGCPGFGIRGDQLPSTGDHGGAYPLGAISLPADAAVEIAAPITRQPTRGVLRTYSDMSFEYTGASDSFDFQIIRDGVDGGTYTVALTTAGVAHEPAPAALAITGPAPSVTQSIAVSIGASAALTLTVPAPSVTKAVSCVPAAAGLSVSGYAPTVVRNVALQLSAATGLSISGHAPAVQQLSSATLTPAAAALVLTGHAPTVVNAPPASIPVQPHGQVPTQNAMQGLSAALDMALYFSGNLTPFAYSVFSGALPPGLVLNSASGLISGAFESEGEYDATIRVTDADHNTADTNVSWVVVPFTGVIAMNGDRMMVPAGNSAAGPLGKYVQQPGERLDYIVDYAEWFADRSDLLVAHEVQAPGLTLEGVNRIGNAVAMFLSGGVSAQPYVITVRITTNTGAIKEAEFRLKVKEFA